MSHCLHGRIVRVAVAEIPGCDHKITPPDFAGEVRFEIRHREVCKDRHILDLDIGNADDAIDVKLEFFEDKGDAAFKRLQSHRLPQR